MQCEVTALWLAHLGMHIYIYFWFLVLLCRIDFIFNYWFTSLMDICLFKFSISFWVGLENCNIFTGNYSLCLSFYNSLICSQYSHLIIQISTVSLFCFFFFVSNIVYLHHTLPFFYSLLLKIYLFKERAFDYADSIFFFSI